MSLSSVDAAGWSAQYSGTPPTFNPVNSPETVSVSRAGYDATAGATTHTDSLVITQRVRQAYPNQASLTSNTVALSDYVYSTDTISGVTNNSTETSPKPVANWAMIERQLVGDSVTLELVAFHRDARSGREVAAVEFRVSDGTTTITAPAVSSTVVSGRSSDSFPVIVYRATIDVSSLANPATLICNAKVYPWIGGTASVLDSADQTGEREFSPRRFYRNTSLHAAPRVAYVETAANGGTASGVVSTDPAVAAAAPFDSVLNAINAMHTAGSLDGGIIYIGNDGGTPFPLASTTATRTQANAALTITRKAGVSRTNARISGVFQPRFSWLRFHDVTWIRGSTSQFTVNATPGTLKLYLDDVDVDLGSFNTSLSSSGNFSVYAYGANVSNCPASVFNAGTPEVRMLRGLNLISGTATLESWLILGSNLNGASYGRGARTQSGGVFAFNRNRTTAGCGGTESIPGGYAIVQNIIEYISATTSTGLAVSADGDAGNVTHLIVHNNTFVGANDAGRANVLYDETTGTLRTHKLCSFIGNIHVQLNTKSDVFKLDGTRVGNWPYMYGVGCRGEFSQYRDANGGGIGGSFAQAYPGIGSNIGTSNSTRNDPLFTSYAGTTYNGTSYTAGAGGGTYTISTSSPAKQLVTSAVLSHDLAGTARPTSSDTAGAYTLPETDPSAHRRFLSAALSF